MCGLISASATQRKELKISPRIKFYTLIKILESFGTSHDPYTK